MNRREIKEEAREIYVLISNRSTERATDRIEALLNSDNDKDTVRKFVIELISYFVEQGFSKKAIFLMEKYNIFHYDIFESALEQGDSSIVMLFIKNNFDFGDENPITESLGHSAKLTKLLIKELPVYVNEKIPLITVPLEYAINIYKSYRDKNELLGLINLLLESGAIINGEKSVFRHAIKAGYFEVINKLLPYYKKDNFSKKELDNINAFVSSKIKNKPKEATQWNRIFNIVNGTSLYGKRR